MADFDRTIPPGGEGRITLKVALKGYQGNVKKSATVFSNDPQKSRMTLNMQGTVKALVELRPTNTVSFRGMAAQVSETAIDLIGSDMPFHIQKVETNLGGKVSYQVETVEEGKHYRLKLSNLLKQGTYSGFVKCLTDLAQKPEVVVRVVGYIEGEIAVKPQTVLVGKLLSQQTLRTGQVLVISNRGKPFHITKLDYDNHYISINQQPLTNATGFSLEITPKVESVPAGNRHQTTVTIETDLTPDEKYEVHVHVLNAGEAAAPAAGKDDDSNDDEDPGSSAQPEKQQPAKRQQ